MFLSKLGLFWGHSTVWLCFSIWQNWCDLSDLQLTCSSCDELIQSPVLSEQGFTAPSSSPLSLSPLISDSSISIPEQRKNFLSSDNNQSQPSAASPQSPPSLSWSSHRARPLPRTPLIKAEQSSALTSPPSVTFASPSSAGLSQSSELERQRLYVLKCLVSEPLCSPPVQSYINDFPPRLKFSSW